MKIHPEALIAKLSIVAEPEPDSETESKTNQLILPLGITFEVTGDDEQPMNAYEITHDNHHIQPITIMDGDVLTSIGTSLILDENSGELIEVHLFEPSGRTKLKSWIRGDDVLGTGCKVAVITADLDRLEPISQ